MEKFYFFKEKPLVVETVSWDLGLLNTYLVTVSHFPG